MSRTTTQRRGALLVFAALASAAVACGGPVKKAPAQTGECGVEVIFSIANQDRSAAETLVDISVDGTPVFHGTVTAAQGGEYIYVSTRLPRHEADIAVKSASAGGTLDATRRIGLEDHVWIVVTRLREEDREPELKLEVSYEKSAADTTRP